MTKRSLNIMTQESRMAVAFRRRTRKGGLGDQPVTCPAIPTPFSS